MGDEDHGHVPLALLVLQQVEDLGLDGDVERGGGLVGEQQLRTAGQGDGDHHPLAHAAGQLVGVLRSRRSGSGMPTDVSSAEGGLLRLRPW